MKSELPQFWGRNSITMLEDFKDSPSRPSDKSDIKMKTLE